MELSSQSGFNQTINEEYKIWKKNTPFLYDLVFTRVLEWPSLTVEWYPERRLCESRDYSSQNLVLGTHTSIDAKTSQKETNYLLIADAHLPLEDTPIDISLYDEQRGEIGGFGGVLSKVDIRNRIQHPTEVNRARLMPQNSSIIATKTASPEVLLFNTAKYESTTSKDIKMKPEVLTGHDTEGYGLSWNPLYEGKLISGSADAKICYWDIQNYSTLQTYTFHKAGVNDVSWHYHHDAYFGSVCEEGIMALWDTRNPPSTGPLHWVRAHEKPVNSIAFNPLNEWLVLTGSVDSDIRLWDLRKISEKLHTFSGHSGDICHLQWAPFNEAIFASCAKDRRIHIWDLSRINQKQSPEDKEDGPPELLFIHGGHTAMISEFSWNPQDDWVIASVAEDNILQIWKMAESIYNEEDLSDPMEI